ncbi:MAG TPA: nuclear transport factor 2 family protein, partial [Acidimicrobiales bacterium]|nr:nuclear transport factor 2 family protein [Acidimicrobiales bacterium]
WEGADPEMLSYVLCATVQTKITRLEYFALDQRELALARLDALPRGRSPTSSRRRVHPNTATDSSGMELLAMGDLAALASRYSDDFIDVDHVSKVTTGRAELLRMCRIYAAAERGTTESVPLASLGDRHAVLQTATRMEGAAIVESTNRTGVVDVVLIIVTRTDGAGRTTRLERFKPDDLHLALARLIELHSDDELPPERERERHTIAEWFRNRRGGWSEDAVVIDHRSPGIEPLVPFRADVQMDVTDVLAFTERMALIEASDNSTQLRTLVLTQFGDDGLVHRSEWYRPDQIDEAFYRFDDLSSASGLGEFPPANTATLARRQETDALVRGDLGEYLACFAPDVIYEDHMWQLSLRGVQVIEDNARHVLTMFANFAEVGAQLLATRGDRLSLHRSRWQAHLLIDSGPIDVDSIELTETDQDGLVCYFSRYNADSCDAAYAELDARYAAGEGAPFADTIRLFAQCGASYNERDWVRFQSFLADDVELVDHRTLGWGQLDRDGTVAIFQSLVDLAPDNRSRIRVLYRVTHHGVVASYQATGTDTASGGEFTRDAIEIMIFEGGLIQRLEFFATDDLQRALGRFDELCSTPNN